jgi:hypothetical protein
MALAILGGHFVQHPGQFRFDRQTGQPAHLLFAVEAAGMLPQVERIADPFGIAVQSCGEFDSTQRSTSWRRSLATGHEPKWKRIRRIVAIPTSDPPDSFTDAGIVRLVPGLADHMNQIASLPDAEWKRYHLEKVRDRLDATDTVVKRGYRPWR